MSRAGTTFTFVARDSDGLPIVGENFNGYPRVESFVAELHWEGSDPPPVERLPITFIGNRELQPDGTWRVEQDAPREKDGTFHVAVSLMRTGAHSVRIKGPTADGSSLLPSDYLPWEVHVNGICPLGQLPLVAPPWLCGCAAGTQPPAGGFGSNIVCQECPIGRIKETNGNTQCYSCLEAIVRERGDLRFAAERTITAVEGSSAIHECGCSSGFFLTHIGRALATEELSAVCPPYTSMEFEARTLAFRPACCNTTRSADCTSFPERMCLVKTCKTAHLVHLNQQRIDMPNVSGVCTSCSLQPSGLLMEGVQCAGGMRVVEQLEIENGFWRANELSEVVKPCITKGACVGINNERRENGVLDALCSENRHGPYCEVCYPGYFKNDIGNCTECLDPFSTLSGGSVRTWLPFAILVSVVLTLFTTFIVSKVVELLKEKPTTPLAWEVVELPEGKKKKAKNEIFSRRLKDSLRSKRGQTPVNFTKADWNKFKIRFECKPQNYIKVPQKGGRPTLYYRPMDTSIDKPPGRIQRMIPASWRVKAAACRKSVASSRVMFCAILIVNILVMRPVRRIIAFVRSLLSYVSKRVGSAVKAVGKQKHKMKILLSMFQVQDGLSASFDLLLPLSFTTLLSNLNFLMISLPLDCLFPTNFHVELLYRTALPLFLEIILLCVAMFATGRMPPIEMVDRRKPRSKLMMIHMASTIESSDPSGRAARRLDEAIDHLMADASARLDPSPKFERPPPLEPMEDDDDHDHDEDAEEGERGAGTGFIRPPPRVVIPSSPPASPPDAEKAPPSELKRQRSVRFDHEEAKVQVYKETLEKAAISEVAEQVKTARLLRKTLFALIITGILNVYTPQGILAIAAAVLIRSINESDLRPERSLKVSLAQLQGKKDGLVRVKRRIGLARTFVIIADLLAILWGGITGIFGAVSAVLQGSAFPEVISYVLITVAILSFSLVVSTTLTSILADRQLFMIELKLSEVRLAEDKKKNPDDNSSRHSGSSRTSGGSKSSRATQLIRDQVRDYWKNLSSKCIDQCFAILFLFYPSCSSITFSAFDCETFDDGTRFLRGDYSIDCDSAEHQFFQMYAIMMIFVWPIGVPMIYAVSIYLRSGVFSSLKRIQTDVRRQRHEQEMRALIAKEEDNFAADYEKDEVLSEEKLAKREKIRELVNIAMEAKQRETEEQEKREAAEEAAKNKAVDELAVKRQMSPGRNRAESGLDRNQSPGASRRWGAQRGLMSLQPRASKESPSPQEGSLNASAAAPAVETLTSLRGRWRASKEGITEPTPSPWTMAKRRWLENSRPAGSTSTVQPASRTPLGRVKRNWKEALSPRWPRKNFKADGPTSSPPASPPSPPTPQLNSDREAQARAAKDAYSSLMKKQFLEEQRRKREEHEAKRAAEDKAFFAPSPKKADDSDGADGPVTDDDATSDGTGTMDEAKDAAKEAALEELEGMTGAAYEEPDFMSEDRLESMRILSEYNELAGLHLEVQAGEITISAVWPTALVSKDLMHGEGSRYDYAQYIPSLEERLALTSYVDQRRAELEARAMRLWLKDTRQESMYRSVLLLLKPAGFESVDAALDQSISSIKEDEHLGLPDERLEKYIRLVASKDLFRRMGGKQRASWLRSAGSRISTPKPGDELLAVITADGVRHDVRSKHAKELSKPLSKSAKKLDPAVREAFAVLDEDKSKMLDMDELNEGLAALGINRSDKQARKILAKIDEGGDRQFSVYEFDRLVGHINYARAETDSDRMLLKQKAHEQLRRAGTELVLTDPSSDVVKLELKRGTGKPFVVEIHRGLAPFPVRTLVAYQAELPVYVRSLTDAYKLEWKYWELFECFRKVTLVGAFIIFGQGSIEQLLIGMTVCAVSIAVYNNIKPYDTWQNNMLQQVCQFNIFNTLLSGLILRTMQSESPGKGFSEGNAFIGTVLAVFTILTTMLTIPTAMLDYVPDPFGAARSWRRIGYRFLKGCWKNLKKFILGIDTSDVLSSRTIGEGGAILDAAGETVFDVDGLPMVVDAADAARRGGFEMPLGGSIGKGGVVLDADGKPMKGSEGEVLVVMDSRVPFVRYAPQLDPQLPDPGVIEVLRRRDKSIAMCLQRDSRIWQAQQRLRVSLSRRLAKRGGADGQKLSLTRKSGSPVRLSPSRGDASDDENDKDDFETDGAGASSSSGCCATSCAVPRSSALSLRRFGTSRVLPSARMSACTRRRASLGNELEQSGAESEHEQGGDTPSENAQILWRRSSRSAMPAARLALSARRRRSCSTADDERASATDGVAPPGSWHRRRSTSAPNEEPSSAADGADPSAAPKWRRRMSADYLACRLSAQAAERRVKVAADMLPSQEVYLNAEVEEEEDDEEEEKELALEDALQQEVDAREERIRQLEIENEAMRRHANLLEATKAHEWSDSLRRERMATTKEGRSRVQLSNSARMSLPRPPAAVMPSKGDSTAQEKDPYAVMTKIHALQSKPPRTMSRPSSHELLGSLTDVLREQVLKSGPGLINAEQVLEPVFNVPPRLTVPARLRRAPPPESVPARQIRRGGQAVGRPLQEGTQPTQSLYRRVVRERLRMPAPSLGISFSSGASPSRARVDPVATTDPRPLATLMEDSRSPEATDSPDVEKSSGKQTDLAATPDIAPAAAAAAAESEGHNALGGAPTHAPILGLPWNGLGAESEQRASSETPHRLPEPRDFNRWVHSAPVHDRGDLVLHSAHLQVPASALPPAPAPTCESVAPASKPSGAGPTQAAESAPMQRLLTVSAVAPSPPPALRSPPALSPTKAPALRTKAPALRTATIKLPEQFAPPPAPAPSTTPARAPSPPRVAPVLELRAAMRNAAAARLEQRRTAPQLPMSESELATAPAPAEQPPSLIASTHVPAQPVQPPLRPVPPRTPAPLSTRLHRERLQLAPSCAAALAAAPPRTTRAPLARPALAVASSDGGSTMPVAPWRPPPATDKPQPPVEPED